MNKHNLKSLENLKAYKKEVVLIGLYQYQIRATVDFGRNKIMYRVGDLNSTQLTDTLDKAIEIITELVEKDTSCN